MAQMIFDEVDFKIDRMFYWTDSRSVLKFIHNESKRFHTFESNRLTLIHQGSKVSDWHWVNRDSNPADDGSTGLKLNSTLRDNRWLNGPDFLLKEEPHWPKIIDIPVHVLDDDDPEVRKEARIYHTTKNQDSLRDLMHHYSSWWKLKRAVSWLLRLKTVLLDRIRFRKDGKQPNSIPKYLTVNELRNSEIEILRFIQREAFPDALKALTTDGGDKWKSSNALLKDVGTSQFKLNPYLRRKLMCVGGRLDNAPIDGDLRHPIILPYKHFVTDLIIWYYHYDVGHMGQESVLSSLLKADLPCAAYWLSVSNVSEEISDHRNS